MPNQLSFAVEFTRAQITEVLRKGKSEKVVFHGSYKYLGNGQWKMIAEVTASEDAKTGSGDIGCPQPCKDSLNS